WYTGPGDGTITKFPVTATSFSIASVSGAPDNIALGPDGALWFTDQVNNVIGRYDESFAVKTFSVPTANSGPSGIVTGPDGAIWFTEQFKDKIGRLQ
ncbi:MAG: virginiamycin B lyase, partial [Candidatus Eremiobacteraeota bacterium]|nr:virginiamycin B lyase [Candidatus Eremiobacteraeota bacterium]